MSTTTTGHFDAIVVGAGIMGSCTAFELSSRGLSVLLLEQFDLLHHLGSSHGESRTIRATYPEPYYTQMVLESHRLWLHAESLAGYRVLTPTRHLDIGPASCRSLQLAISSCRIHSVPFRILTPQQLDAEFSGAFRIPEDWIGVVSELGGVIKPTKAVAMFQALASSKGAVLRDRAKVIGIRRAEIGEIAVTTDDGADFRTSKVVVAAGAWTRRLLNEISGRDIPIQPIHTTICYWKIREGHEAELTASNGFPTFASYGEPFIYGTPSLEFPGLIKVAHHGGRGCDPDARDWRVDVEKALGDFVEQVVGGKVEKEGPVAAQACMYSMTADGDFVVDYVGGELGRDAVVAGGFSGHGFKMGPAVGRMVADLVEGREEALVEWLRARRFEDCNSGNAKDFVNPVPVDP